MERKTAADRLPIRKTATPPGNPDIVADIQFVIEQNMSGQESGWMKLSVMPGGIGIFTAAVVLAVEMMLLDQFVLTGLSSAFLEV